MLWLSISQAAAQTPVARRADSMHSPSPVRTPTCAEAPLPTLAGNAVKLRVAHVVNPRFGAFSGPDLARFFASAARTSAEQFGVQIEFENPEEIAISSLFGRIGAEKRAALSRYQFDAQTGDPTRIERAFAARLRTMPVALPELIRFSKEAGLDVSRVVTLEALVSRLTMELLDNHYRCRRLAARDGKAVIDDDPYNEWLYWESIGAAVPPLPYEVIITNQLICSVEYVGQDLHSAMRGGLVFGNTTYNSGSRLGTTTEFSTFVFSRNDVGELLQGEVLGEGDAIDLAGSYFAHELGHQLFHYAHPFGSRGCIMEPAKPGKLKAWRAGLDRQACDAGGHAAMKPGASPFKACD